MFNILLSGSTGFLGRALKDSIELQNIGIIRGLSASSQGKSSRIDLRFPFDLSADFMPDIVIHAAGKAHSVPKTENERREFYEINFEGTKNFCHALGKLDRLPRSFIFISTVAVYGLDEGECIDESSPLNGVTPYAKSKILAESWLIEWADKNNVTLCILRLPLIAGPNPPGNLGAMINGIKSGRYLSIAQADARKSVVWAEDIAQIIPRASKIGGIYNLTDGYHPTFGELEETIAYALEKKKPLKVPYWLAKGLALTGDVIGDKFPINSDKLWKITSTLTFDDSKARSELGWVPTPLLSKIDEIV